MQRLLVFSGRMRAGKDTLAAAIGAARLSFAAPLYEVADRLIPGWSKDRVEDRAFLQSAGRVLRGRSERTGDIRAEASDVLRTFSDLGFDGAGRDDCLTRVLISKARKTAEAGHLVAVTNARFPDELAALKDEGFSHFHVSCSARTRAARIGHSLSSSTDRDPSERMAAFFDLLLNGANVVWNDPEVPLPSGRSMIRSEEFISAFGHQVTQAREGFITPSRRAPSPGQEIGK